jgi:hypothetical protein
MTLRSAVVDNPIARTEVYNQGWSNRIGTSKLRPTLGRSNCGLTAGRQTFRGMGETCGLTRMRRSTI